MNGFLWPFGSFPIPIRSNEPCTEANGRAKQRVTIVGVATNYWTNASQAASVVYLPIYSKHSTQSR